MRKDDLHVLWRVTSPRRGLVSCKLSDVKIGQYFWFRGNRYLKLRVKPKPTIRTITKTENGLPNTKFIRDYFHHCVRLDTSELVMRLGSNSVLIER